MRLKLRASQASRTARKSRHSSVPSSYLAGIETDFTRPSKKGKVQGNATNEHALGNSGPNRYHQAPNC